MKQPLAELLRPKTFSDVFGLDEILDKDGWIQASIRSQKPMSVLFFGPAGCGKTTLARIYLHSFDAQCIHFHPATHGTSDLKNILKQRQEYPILLSKPLVLFVDEIHRWNRAQQDTFLPYLEDGSITLVAATTENPSFALNSALLSRIRIVPFSTLSEPTLKKILDRAVSSSLQLSLSEECKEYLISESKGDARHLLNMLETIKMVSNSQTVTMSILEKALHKKAPIYDRSKEQHYNLISALHKAIRGSDPDATLYWLSRMLISGEDPNFIARRLLRIATEDIGLADPQAVGIALDAWQSFERIGSYEGELFLAQAAVYLALAPKSCAIYKSYTQARSHAEDSFHYAPPHLICNAPNKFMKEMGYGQGYLYDHDTLEGFSGQNYFPDGIERRSYYNPIERGFEREMKKRKEYFEGLRKKKKTI
jgi:putative ATPase